MLAWLRTRWRALLARRTATRQIAPETFRHMAAEVGELAGVAGRVGPQDQEFQARIRRIQAEMVELTILAGRPEFRDLPEEKRLALRQSLLDSRDQLLETMHEAPSPTSLLQ